MSAALPIIAKPRHSAVLIIETMNPCRRSGIKGFGFWKRTMRDDHAYTAHVDNVHINAVIHGLSSNAANWRYSSFNRAVAMGVSSSDWPRGGLAFHDRGDRYDGGWWAALTHPCYVHFNAVNYVLAATVADWRYVSCHRAVAIRAYPAAWA